MGRFLTVMVVAVLLAAGPVAADLSFAGGLMLSGDVVQMQLAASYPVLREPAPVYADVLLVEDEVALGLSAPVRVALDPLAAWAGIEWSPWAEVLLDRCSVGVAGWRSSDRITGGAYLKLTALALEW